MTDTRGRVYLDFLSGCSALNYGHNDPDMAAALVNYISRGGIAHGLDLHTQAKADLIEAMSELILDPRGLPYRIQFTGPTGTNAVEAALKLARKVTGRSQVIAFTGGFHGMTLGALAATGNRQQRMGAGLPLSGVTRLPFDGYMGDDFDTAELLDRLLSDPSGGVDIPAAILLETVQGEGGLSAASPAWVRRVSELARRHGALLIVDDIQAGCGRTGAFFSFEDLGIVPDLVTVSKSISGFGLPMALLLLRPELDIWDQAEHNGTFRGNNLAFVTGAVALRKFWSTPEFEANTRAKGARIQARLEGIAASRSDVHAVGRGMLLGLDVGSGPLAVDVRRRCFEAGLILETCGAGDRVLKILPPLNTPEDLLEKGLTILDQSVRAAVQSAASEAQDASAHDHE